MKKSFRIAAIILIIPILLGLVAWAFIPSDTVSSQYVTLEEAYKDEIFARGWLPDIFPSSTKDIYVSNNLDLNTSEGSLSFNPVDWPRLERRLFREPLPHAPFVNWYVYVKDREANGYAALSYVQDGTNWMFFCKPQLGHCEYVMWHVRRPNLSFKRMPNGTA